MQEKKKILLGIVQGRLSNSPKQILQGVDLTNSSPLLVPENSSAIFSGNLIHGAAINNTDKIRFSVDFRIMDKRLYKAEESKSKLKKKVKTTTAPKAEEEE